MLKKLLSAPGYTLTIIVTLAIIYLTIVPKPLPDMSPKLFEGADKVVHALMFFGFAGAFGLDYLRSGRGYAAGKLPSYIIIIAVVISIVFGGVVELVQGAMNMGRGEDIYDFLADVSGAVLSGAVMFIFRRPVFRWWWMPTQSR